MPATPARIGFILQEFRKVTVESPGVVTKYGDAARTSDDPVETFFNTTADALAMAQERQDLLDADRRQFQAVANGTAQALGMDYSATTPTVRVVDTELEVDQDAIVIELSVDLGADRQTITAWG
ncbi:MULTISPECIES: hypothetical protein [unclassified Blastomonas]|uniref:hypothetical protein n=1 Tax=unclassified Blastomonas TaxID=2626550 RepID=UPI0008240AB0|nr:MULTISPECIES: hypothetical protein [unclassified Blastomonas]